MELFVEDFEIDGVSYTIAATPNGLAYFSDAATSHQELSKFFPGYTLKEDSTITEPYMKPLRQYFAGDLQAFDFPVDLVGTNFQQTVWKELQKVPFGATISYSELAERIAKPTAVRAVANAVGRNPLFVVVPCHRVLGKNGRLTGFRGGLEMKRQLLNLEKSSFLE